MVYFIESNKLVILKANASDSGSYKCEADNGYSKAESTISVIVEGKSTCRLHFELISNQFNVTFFCRDLRTSKLYR